MVEKIINSTPFQTVTFIFAHMHPYLIPERRYLKVFLILLTLLISQARVIRAQAPEQWTSAKILHELQRFNTLGTVLYVAAHPDDENTRLISWLVGEKKLRTAYLSLTRGDGGQNLIGKEQGPLLGVIRTQELLAARRVDGAEQYFTRAYDFGYSKTPDETLRLWHQDSIVKDMVKLIRRLKPDVIICRFPDTGEGGHGHHTASAILAKIAFEQAADKTYAPETGTPWKANRLFWNTFSFGTVNTTSDDQIWLDAGTYNPLLGSSYGEIASNSRSQHKSQGFGTSAQRGEVKEYFIQWGGDAVSKDIFEGLDFSWDRVNGGKKVDSIIRVAITAYDILEPGKILPTLISALKKLKLLSVESEVEQQWVNYKIDQLNKIIQQCAGIWMSASVSENAVTPGDSIEIRFDFIHRHAGDVTLLGATYEGNELAATQKSSFNQLISVKKKCIIHPNQLLTSPYWLKGGIANNQFAGCGSDCLQAELQDGPSAIIRFKIDGEIFEQQIPIQHRYVNPVDGEMFQPLMVLPPVTLSWSENVLMLREGSKPALNMVVKSQKSGVIGTLQVMVKGQRVSSSPFTISEKGNSQIIPFDWKWLPDIDKEVVLTLEAEVESRRYSYGLTVLEYGHIPRQSILFPAEIRIVPLKVKTSGGNIGYIAGAGDEVPAALRQLGYQVIDINEQNYDLIDFSGMKAIVTGIRAYNTHSWLNEAYPKLMKFIENGGNLIVQYNTNNRLGPLIAKVGPYDFTITRDRVTDETAEVRFLLPDHPILHQPNKITPSDFEGWIQERGIYFSGQKAPEFQSLFSMNDNGENPLDGSTIIATYGKGNFIYTGLAFFRQLPHGVPGAYRLFTNLVETD
jgi:LmbE family N-acetylglucosaminyl deacetylase